MTWEREEARAARDDTAPHHRLCLCAECGYDQLAADDAPSRRVAP